MGQADPFRHVEHAVDFCVVGGGMAGLCAALAAARHGAKVALMHDRPVLGGNASSETRVHICGADRHNRNPFLRETGILEELRLENVRRNPNRNFSVWDTILYEKARYQENLTLLLNGTCQQARMEGGRIASVTGWQLTTQTYHTVRARLFADCSGDGILAPLTGALCRMGREARGEYGEPIAPEVADERTMGMSILFGTREYPTPQPFEPPAWACRFQRDEDIPYAAKGHTFWGLGYWWIELGGEHHAIHDTEELRDELLKIAYGVWDHIKNRGDHGAAHWALDWVQFLPAKRESRRYVGEHVLTQRDIEAEGRFDDLVAYGGWSMDDHHPAGFRAVRLGQPATIFHPAPSPYGIPLRALYSRNVENLLFAGRDASCTHAAMSSTRVMGTGCSMGQAVGVAAAMALERGVMPRGLLPHVRQLQQRLLRDDCYLPWVSQEFSPLTLRAKLSASRGNPQPVRDGVNRPVGGDSHGWESGPGDSIEYVFDSPQAVREATLLVDSALGKQIQLSHHGRYGEMTCPPDVMPRAFRVQGLIDGQWVTLHTVTDNHQRLVRLPLGGGSKALGGVRYVLDATWGGGTKPSNLYAFYVD